MQLSLFPPEPKPDKRPWDGCWDWFPEVGKPAHMGIVILKGQGYCYGDRVVILSMTGENVTAIVKPRVGGAHWKEGTIYHCVINDLWPPVGESWKENIA